MNSRAKKHGAVDRPGTIRGPRPPEVLQRLSEATKRNAPKGPPKTKLVKAKIAALSYYSKMLRRIFDFPDSPFMQELVQDLALTRTGTLPKWRQAQNREKYRNLLTLVQNDSSTASDQDEARDQ